ncbi:MAG TPA: ABC-2 family transporter protein [Vicinamibacterales bacterium]|nr:ABC-2 family transporter protein [Vicinamibacterales bacterium]
MKQSSGTLTFVGALATTNLKAALALRGSFLLQAVFMALNNFSFFVFWWALMRNVRTIRGWELGDIELLFGIVATAFGLTVTVAGGVRHLGRFIDEGDLDTLLTQPRPVLAYALGMRSVPSGVGDMCSGIAFIAWSGRVSWPLLPYVATAVGASAIVFVACGVVFYSLAFWFGRVETVARMLWDLVITFAVYPEPLFGGALRLVLFTLLPAGFVGYLPVWLVREPTLRHAALLMTGSVAYLAAAVLIFDRGLRRYASGSRFSTFG